MKADDAGVVWSFDNDLLVPRIEDNQQNTFTSVDYRTYNENKRIIKEPVFDSNFFNLLQPEPFSNWGIRPELMPTWPTESKRITWHFGEDHPLGIDIGGTTAGQKGDEIRASMSGIVTTVGIPNWSASESTYVIVRGDDGKEYRYTHLDINSNVYKGMRIRQGQLLGTMNDNGAPGQVHLHFEVRIDGKPVDPENLFYLFK